MSLGKRDIERVLIASRYSRADMGKLTDALGTEDIIRLDPKDSNDIVDALRVVDVCFIDGEIDERFLDTPRLRWVHCSQSGLSGSALPEMLSRGLIVSGSAGRSAPALAQHAFFFALAFVHDAYALLEAQKSHCWRTSTSGRPSLWGMTLGIVGLGHTGREIALLGRAFGMRVIAYTRSSPQSPSEGVDLLWCADRGETIDPLLETADIIVLATSLNNQTHRVIGEDEFSKMKSSCLLINLGRGQLIDTESLLNALETDRISGAGLDVFDTEPLPENSPLWEAPNLMITPHTTPKMFDRDARALEIALDNIEHYRRKETLINQITEQDILSV